MKKILPALFSLAMFLLAGRAKGEELEQRIVNPKTINSTQTISLQQPSQPDYSIYRVYAGYGNGSITIYYNKDFNVIKEEEELNNLFNKISTGEIDSYQQFTKELENFSEEQKLTALKGIGYSFVRYGYDWESIRKNPDSSEGFFAKLKDMLSKEKTDLGVCLQFNHHIQKLAQDIGLENSIASVLLSKSELRHAITLVKTDNGIEVVDYDRRISTKTKNTEKALEIYGQELGKESFYHVFFQDGKIKHKIFTELGKSFLSF